MARCFLHFQVMTVNDLRADLAQKILAIEPIEKRLKFVIDGQYILIDGSGKQNTMSDQDGEAECTINMSLDTYLKLQEKKIKPLMATLTGKLKVKGDLNLARKLKQLM